MQSLIGLLFYLYAKCILRLHVFAAPCVLLMFYILKMHFSTYLTRISPLYNIKSISLICFVAANQLKSQIPHHVI